MTAVQRRWVLGGGIASGKSEVRRMLEESGVPVIDADSIGHSVLEPGGPAFAEVAERWPDVVDGGSIDRRRLGEIVFANPDELAALEAITHPHIFDVIRGRMAEITGGVVVEMPLLGRLPDEEFRQLVVDARDEVRLERAVARGMTRDEAVSRMSAQPPRAQWLAAADAVVPNHSSLADLRLTVERMLLHL